MITFRSFPPVLAAALLCTALAVPASAQKMLRTDTGLPGAGFGRAAPAGDVNGDGVTDLIVGAPLDDAAGTDAGAATVLSGGDGGVLLLLKGSGPGDLFGSSCAGVGDVDGDGRDDLLIGAPQSNVPGGRGYVRLVSGASGAVLRTLTGAAAGDQFGAAVAGAGDLDGDGKADVLVGAPLNDAGGNDAGAATAFSGATGAALYSAKGSAGDELGTSVACELAGSLCADNDSDVIISSTCDGGDRSGVVQVRSRTDFALRFKLIGQAGQRLGATIAPAGDVDGDGRMDLLVATDPRDANGAPTAAGSVRLVSGSNGAPLATFSDGQLGTGYGSALAGLGDVTGDGVPDIAVGEPGHDGHGPDSGSVRIYSGSTGKTWYHLLGPNAGATFGASLACAGDINDDGLPDCSVGAPAVGAAVGRVFSMSVTRWEEEVGSGLPGIVGVPRLTGQGGLIAAAEASLTLTDARPGTAATLILGFALVLDPQSNTFVPTQDLIVDGMVTSSDGSLVFDFAWPAGLASGTTVYHQFRIADPSASGGQSRSNAVAAKVP